MSEPVTQIIQIVPRRSTSPEGVGDYARVVAESLSQIFKIETIFVAANAAPPAERVDDKWPTHELRPRNADRLLEAIAALPDAPIILHLSGYGYQRKGVPFWLSRAMRRWRRKNPNRSLITVFHEISATGPFWGSAFWLGPWQKLIARNIMHLSTAAIATTQSYATILNAWRYKGIPTAVSLPVFSTIGEPEQYSNASDRAPTLAVFGRESVSRNLYCDEGGVIAAFVRDNGIETIVDIGKRATPPPAMVGNARLEILGESSPATICTELLRARFGVIAYDADRLAKSTVFSAYCAHGAVPVCISRAAGHNDGLLPDSQYVLLTDNSVSDPIGKLKLDELQRRARSWYMAHSTKRTAEIIYQLLRAKFNPEG